MPNDWCCWLSEFLVFIMTRSTKWAAWVSKSTKIQPKSLKVEITNLLGFTYNKYKANYFLRLSCWYLQKNINTKQLSFESHPVEKHRKIHGKNTVDLFKTEKETSFSSCSTWGLRQLPRRLGLFSSRPWRRCAAHVGAGCRTWVAGPGCCALRIHRRGDLSKMWDSGQVVTKWNQNPSFDEMMINA